MAKTYIDIRQEIAALQKAAETLRRQEVAGVIDRIKTAIAAYGLTAADLGLAAPRGPAPRGPAVRAAVAGKPAAYRDAAGNSWSGRGRRPGWVNAALASGKTLEQLRA